MGQLDLAFGVLQDPSLAPLKDAELAALETGGMIAAGNATATGLDTNQANVEIFQKLEKEADELMAKLTAEEETPSNPETETEAKEPAPEEVEENEETVEASAEEAEQLNPDVPEDTEAESEDSEEVQDDSEDTDETLESESPKSLLILI